MMVWGSCAIEMKKRSVNEHGLTQREQSFADEYLSGEPKHNGTEAYLRMSQKANLVVKRKSAMNGACKMLSSSAVKEYLSLRAKEVTTLANYNQNNWFNDLINVIDTSLARRAKPGTMVVDGVKIQLTEPIYEYDAAAARSALELMAKSNFMPLLKDRIEIDPSDQLKELLDLIKPTLGPPSLRSKK